MKWESLNGRHRLRGLRPLRFHPQQLCEEVVTVTRLKPSVSFDGVLGEEVALTFTAEPTGEQRRQAEAALAKHDGSARIAADQDAAAAKDKEREREAGRRSVLREKVKSGLPLDAADIADALRLLL